MAKIVIAVAALATALALAAPSSARITGSIVATVGPGPRIFVETSVGAPVLKLRAGTYLFVVRDMSNVRNFRLQGPGVNRATPIKRVRGYVWRVKLRKGTYRYFSDRHRSTMRGSFRVV